MEGFAHSQQQQAEHRRMAANLEHAAPHHLQLNGAPHMRNPNTMAALVKKAAMAYIDADVNSDHQLSFEEFSGMLTKAVPDIVHADTTIRELFDMADIDNDGLISQDEFFYFTFRWVTENCGTASSLEGLFRSNDRTGDGQLNLREFCVAVEDLGFGSVGHEIFNELDYNKSGTLSYVELLEKLKQQRMERGVLSDNSKRFLTLASFSLSGLSIMGDDELLEFDTFAWQATAVHEVRRLLCDRMLRACARPFDLWRLLLAKAKPKAQRRLNEPQFCSSIAALGYDGNVHLLQQIFDEVDEMNEAHISFDQFANWLNARPARRKRATQLNLRSVRTPSDTPINEITWTPTVLRQELQAALVRSQLSALDMLMAYDKSEDGDLSLREFNHMIRRLVGDPEVWDLSNVADVVKQVFEQESGCDQSISIEDLEHWLLKNFESVKSAELRQDHKTVNAEAPDTNMSSKAICSRPNAVQEQSSAIPRSEYARGTATALPCSKTSKLTRHPSAKQAEWFFHPQLGSSRSHSAVDFSRERISFSSNASRIHIAPERSLSSVHGLHSCEEVPPVGLMSTPLRNMLVSDKNRRAEATAEAMSELAISTLGSTLSATNPTPKRCTSNANMRFLDARATRLHQMAVRAAGDAQQTAAKNVTGTLVVKRILSAEHASLAATAAAAERMQTAKTMQEFGKNEQTRRRFFREMERRNHMMAITQQRPSTPARFRCFPRGNAHVPYW